MKYNNSKSYVSKITPSVALIAGAMLGSCDHNNIADNNNSIPDNANNSIPDKVNLTGSVQKGPFIQGSDVQIYPLDAAGNNLGAVYSTLTNDNLGNFSTTMAGLSQSYTGNLSLSGNGFFFKEAAGKLSDAPQTLKALYKADGSAAEIHLNLVTHLSYQRATALLKGNSDLNASVAQAQNELTTSLKSAGLVYPADATGFGTGMDLFGSNNGANQYLLALSCAFENAAGSSDSALQDLLNAYQLDLANDGVVASNLNDKVKAGVVSTNPTVCVANLQKRAQELGVIFNVDVNGMNHALDTDLDGIVNFEDLDIDGDGVNNVTDPEPYNPKVKKVVDPASTYCVNDNSLNIHLCWEKNPSTKKMTLTEATEYCKNLDDKDSSWDVPYMGQLVTLIKGCPDSEVTGQWTCGKYYYKCTSSCESLKGPGKDGCYWDPSLGGVCGSYHHALTPGLPDEVWKVDFTKATWTPSAAETPALVRCVREVKGPTEDLK